MIDFNVAALESAYIVCGDPLLYKEETNETYEELNYRMLNQLENNHEEV